ncbi:MAG: GTP-binding protein, partial [Thermoleophilaceae bacterium]
MSAPLTLGTAGHIDHGKTELVRMLTGRSTDRLPDERRRGISIELGYAPLALPGGRRLSVVDVPGHERFVRTMVAGASGIDLFLLCVAADDGVMPQTREHVAVLRALGVGRGVVAVTKADLADPARACAEAGRLVPEADCVPVCAPRGEGRAELVEALERGGEPLLLVLDEFEAIAGSESVRRLDELLDDLPPDVHLVIGSRRRTGMAVGRLALAGRLAEISSE